TSAQANVLGVADAQRFRSLRFKLQYATEDVSQAMDSVVGNNTPFICLELLHQWANSVRDIGAGAGSLIELAALMKDETDELLVLRELTTWLKVLADNIGDKRRRTNEAMSRCSSVATVNVKGQVLINIFTEMNNEVMPLLNRISKVVP